MGSQNDRSLPGSNTASGAGPDLVDGKSAGALASANSAHATHAIRIFDRLVMPVACLPCRAVATAPVTPAPTLGGQGGRSSWAIRPLAAPVGPSRSCLHR